MGCGQSQGGKKPDKATAIKPSVPKAEDKAKANVVNDEYQATIAFLGKVPLFKRLPQDEYPLLAQACIAQDFKEGQVIIKQGSAGSEFFVIRTGEASVTVQDDSDVSEARRVATLKSGDYFGEKALLRNERRAATITALSEMQTVKITRDKFQELNLHEKLHFANRKAVCAGQVHKLKVQRPVEKTPEERSLIAEALRKNGNLQATVDLDDSRIESIVDCCWKEQVEAGKEIITEGDIVADYFYVVQEGSFEVFVPVQLESAEPWSLRPRNLERSASKGQSKYFCTVTSGGSFGELALLYLVPRAATVRAKEDSVVWAIDRGNFKSILMQVAQQKVQERVELLDRIEMLTTLLADEKKTIAEAMVEMHFTKNEVVMQQGEAGTTFYVLYEGEVTVFKDGEEVAKLDASVSESTVRFFGERALLTNEPRAASIQVTSDTAEALALDRDSFNLLLGPLEDILRRGSDQVSMLNKNAKRSSAAERFAQRQRVSRKSLTRIGLLGCGGFGAVELYVHQTTGEAFALKGISKGYIVKTGMKDSVKNEKNILMMTNSPFIIKLYETYNGKQSIYFLMEAALGGELYSLYNRKGFHGKEEHCKFYSAGVVLAFEHLHARRVIYRDLKPENLLLNDQGQLKVTDMGLAKFAIGKAYTTCGTPDYFAPELITAVGHTVAVDWWGLGILIFELMTGHPPFESDDPMSTYARVMTGINKVHFPPACAGSCQGLVKALLKSSPAERLPMRSGGVTKLKCHKWFDGFSWQDMMELSMEPPYKPVVKSTQDLANFNARKEDMPKMLEYVDDGSGWDNDFATN